MKLILKHGFNVKRGGADSLDKLIRPLGNRGYVVEDQDYGDLGLIGVRLYAKKIAMRLAELLAQQTEDVGLVGHSNGANVIDLALWLFAETYRRRPPVHRIVYLSPALNRDTKYPPIPMDRIHVFHTERDMAVKFSELLRWHRWGGAGAYGMTAVGYINHDFTAEVDAHSAWFYDHMVEFTADRIDEVMR